MKRKDNKSIKKISIIYSTVIIHLNVNYLYVLLIFYWSQCTFSFLWLNAFFVCFIWVFENVFFVAHLDSMCFAFILLRPYQSLVHLYSWTQPKSVFSSTKWLFFSLSRFDENIFVQLSSIREVALKRLVRIFFRLNDSKPKNKLDIHQCIARARENKIELINFCV